MARSQQCLTAALLAPDQPPRPLAGQLVVLHRLDAGIERMPVACGALDQAAAAGRQLREIRMEYASEARYGRELTVSWEQDGSRYYITGEGDSCVFRMGLTYRD